MWKQHEICEGCEHHYHPMRGLMLCRLAQNSWFRQRCNEDIDLTDVPPDCPRYLEYVVLTRNGDETIAEDADLLLEWHNRGNAT